jgi:dsDNA-specific endonuclease/ATPase MutS2
MAFRAGDHVHVASLGKGVIREVRNGRRYLVELKGHSIVVSEAQLTAVEAPKRPRISPTNPPTALPESVERTHVPVSIDLHGMTTEQAVAALDTFINDAILASHDDVSGRLKAAVHQRLKKLPVRGFRIDASNPGVTIVTL